MSRNRTPRSPYAKHAKAPYKYSPAYDRWASATSEEERNDADAAFRRLYGIPTWIIEPGSGRVTNFPRHPAARRRA
jgi:hypothetical protein